MDRIQLEINNTVRAGNTGRGFFAAVKKTLFIDKLNNRGGIILLALLALAFGAGVAKFGIVFSVLVFGAIIATWVMAGIIASINFGIVVVVVMAFMLFMLMRIGVSGPVGILMDALQVILMISTLVRLKREDNWELLRGPVSTVVLIWIGYNVLQFVNPFAESRLAWVYTIRTVAIVLFSYFVFVYNIRTIGMLRIAIKVWLLLALIGALYAYKQEYIGFSAAEDAYLHSDPEIASLLFIGGHWRKFSIFSDPVAFAYNMVMPSIICICVMAGKFKLWQKIVAGLMVCMFLQSMLFSGTRGANVLLPAAMVLFAILNFNKKVLIFAIMGAVFLVVLINIPTSNPNIMRFQTAFRPNNDDSYNLRKMNQKRIQPFIQSHPFGGGLGATGTWGKRFAPGSYLANFPPDSGYIRTAVELGWVGLIIFCTMVFVILKTGINYFYRIRDAELKTYCLAMTLVVFAYNIANFPQEALVQYPSNLLFPLAAALITVSYRLDRQKRNGDNITEPTSVKY
ncbi:O-antigen ligase family protein [Mucilaginibacter defluvii]|uniref:O-antigen ligase-related domain-containing protein n=1 Tax=Mucilaginibacter defluvii TaxID=1196019 RepID=A0ABP9FQL1_9SPHI